MFGSLKEKLKGWLKKSKEDEEEIVEEPVKKKKSTKKKETKDLKKKVKETKKEKPTSKKSTSKTKATSENLQSENYLNLEFENKSSKPEENIKTKSFKDENEKIDDSKQIEQEEPSPEPQKKNFLSKLFGKKQEQQIQEEKITAHLDEEEPEIIKEIEEDKKKKTLSSIFSRKLTEEKFEEMFEELELILLQNNVAFEVVEKIKNSLQEKLVGQSLKEVDLPFELKDTILSLLINPPNIIKQIKESIIGKKPFVILFAGINGSGKTTTIAKVANYLKKNHLTVCLAAADTFRAASIEQIEIHANKLNVPLIKKDYGADPASVGFDAITYARKNKIDVVLIDTAGRMQNKDSLMKEIEKISRVNKPDMKIFLGESITGNDCTEQAKSFNDALDLTGIILSKADVDEKGGTAISVSYITKKPILFLGTGQSYDDLEVFDREKLVKKLGL